jgi:hypothetical protein
MAEILKFVPRRERAEMLGFSRSVVAPGNDSLRNLQRDRMRAVWRQDANGRLFIQWKIDNDATI